MPKFKTTKDSEKKKRSEKFYPLPKQEKCSDNHLKITEEINLNFESEKLSENLETNMAQPVQAGQPGQAAQPVFTISISDLLKDAQRIQEFRGDSYALTSFLRDVDTLLPLFDSCLQAKQYVFQRIIVNKIQGPALDVIRTLGADATWATMKTALIQNFGVKETYHQLYRQAFSTRNNQVREYFNALLEILSKLNEKYEYDDRKPAEFKPEVNEETILRTFLNNIDPNLASIVLSRNIENFREAFTLLENLGMIRDRNKPNYNINQNRSINFNKNRSPREHNNHRQDVRLSQPNNNFRHRHDNSGHFRQNNNNYSRPVNNNYRRSNDNYSRQSRQNYYNRSFGDTQRQENRSEPMEIDHIEHHENFQSAPPKATYP